MSFSKADLIANPNLLALVSPSDQKLLGLTPAQTQAPALTAPSTPESPPTSTTPTLNVSPPASASPGAISPSKKTSPKPGKPELQSHAEFLHWIKKINRSFDSKYPILAIHADPTSPSGIIPGWPDFTLFWDTRFQPLPLFIEFKRPKQGRLSPAQTLIHRYLKNLGHDLKIAFSCSDAITYTERHFGLNGFNLSIPQV